MENQTKGNKQKGNNPVLESTMGTQKNRNKNATWIKESEDEIHTNQMEDAIMIAEVVTNQVKRIKNWHLLERINSWLLAQKSNLYPIIAKQLNQLFRKGDISNWLIGKMYMIQEVPSIGTTPGNYKPITCLPTMFKLFIGIIVDNIYIYLEEKTSSRTERK